MLAATCGKIVREIYLLMSTEIAEAAEPARREPWAAPPCRKSATRSYART